MRAIPTARLLQAIAKVCNVEFQVQGQTIAPTLVFSPVMFLPVVLARGRALAQAALGSDTALGIDARERADALFGVRADAVMTTSGVVSILRSSILSVASASTFSFALDEPSASVQRIDLGPLIDAWSAPELRTGQSTREVLLGRQIEELSNELRIYETPAWVRELESQHFSVQSLN